MKEKIKMLPKKWSSWMKRQRLKKWKNCFRMTFQANKYFIEANTRRFLFFKRWEKIGCGYNSPAEAREGLMDELFVREPLVSAKYSPKYNIGDRVKFISGDSIAKVIKFGVVTDIHIKLASDGHTPDYYYDIINSYNDTDLIKDFPENGLLGQ